LNIQNGIIIGAQAAQVDSGAMVPTGVTPGTFNNVTVDTAGRVTFGANVASDLTSLRRPVITPTGSYTVQPADLGAFIYFASPGSTLTTPIQPAGFWFDFIDITGAWANTVFRYTSDGSSWNNDFLVRIIDGTTWNFNPVVENGKLATPGNVLTDMGPGQEPVFTTPVTGNVIRSSLATNYTMTSMLAPTGLAITVPPGVWFVYCTAYIPLPSNVNTDYFNQTNGTILGQFTAANFPGTSGITAALGGIHTFTVTTTIQYRAQWTVAAGPVVAGGGSSFMQARQLG
jgi:hypothetical protein